MEINDMKTLFCKFSMGFLLLSASSAFSQLEFPGADSLRSGCKLSQFAGISDSGTECRVNVSFGRRAALGGGSNTVCVPNNVASGNILIDDENGEIEVYEGFSSQPLEARTPRPILSDNEDVALDRNSISIFDPETQRFTIKIFEDVYSVYDVRRFAGHSRYQLGGIIERNRFVSEHSCTITGEL